MRVFLTILGLCFFSIPALATPVTFTGAELANLPGASFPTGGQSLSGDGLRLDLTVQNAVLYRLDLSNFIVDPSNISITVQAVRLLDDSGFDANQDVFIGLYDGQNFFNTQFFDVPNPQRIGPQNRVDLLNASETQFIPGSFTQQGSTTSSPIGSVARLDVTIRATPTSTTIIGDINQTGGVTSSPSTLLNTNSTLSLIIAGNTLGGNHLINSLTFNSGVSGPTAVVEPGAVGGMALGLLALGLGLYRRRLAY